MRNAIKIAADALPSDLPEIPQNVPLYKQLSGRPLAKCLLRLTWERLLNTWCIWHGAFRSCCGHIRIQSPTEMPHLSLGPAQLLWSDGSQRLAPRTLARSESTESLSAKYPWVDIVDLRMFLMGFDAGESYARSTSGTETDKRGAQGDASLVSSLR